MHADDTCRLSSRESDPLMINAVPQLRRHWFGSFSTAAVVPLLYGMEVGATSNVLRILDAGRDAGTTEEWILSLSSIQLGLVASGALLGAIVGSFAAIRLADILGRKKEFIVAAVALSVGALTACLAPNLTVLLVGRLLFGFGEGVGMHAALLYTGEIVPTVWRGVCGGSIEVLWVFGLFCSMAFGLIVDSWRAMYAPLAAVSVPLLLACLLLPESPRWIVLDRRSEGLPDAVEAFKQLGREHHESVDLSRDILEHIERTEGDDADLEEVNFLAKKSLFVGVVIVLFQQLTGQPTLLYHMGELFDRVGLGKSGAIIVAAVKTVATAIAVSQIEKLGRRTLLMTGISLMAVAMAALSALYALDPAWLSYAVLAALVVFVIGYQVGFGPVTWLLLSEIFPLQRKAMAMSICTLTNFTVNWLVLFFYDMERNTMGEAAQFAQYALLAVAALVFVFWKVPETKGLDLEQISEQFHHM